MAFIFRRSFFLLALLLLLRGTATAQTFWMQHAGGTTIDQAMDVSLDGTGNTFVTGYFTSAAAFGSTTLNSSGVDDVFLAKLGTNGLFIWAVKAGGPASDRALSIKTDASGNSYITGFFYGTATFGSTTINAAGAQDIFIAKYNNAGVCQWAKSAGGTGADIGNGITVDNSGNVIVTGEFAGNATFGSTSLTSMNGSTDVFTTKLDASGNFLWTKQGSASLTDRGLDVDCDASGNIYITGQFSDTITFDVTHTNNMLNAVFLVKYNPAGQEQWYRKIGGGAVNVANSIVCDNTSGIYLTGDFQGTLTFFGSTNTTLSAAYTNRIFLAKYDGSGGLTWDVAESSESPLTARSIATNGTDCFITGNFKCTFNSYSDRYGVGLFNSSGFWDIFEGKYSAGSGVWSRSRQLGGKQDQIVNGIAVDASGNPHLAGSYDLAIVTPVDPSFYGFPGFAGYNMTLNTDIPSTGNYCSDMYYASYAMAASAGNSDIFVGDPIDPNRAPFDYYYRSGGGCSVPYLGTCINLYTGLDFLCGSDTVNFCQQGQLYGSSMTSTTGTSNSIGPDFNYLWSNGQTTNFTNVSTSGYYNITMTSADGCYISEDTVYVAIHNPPATPTISDNVVINNNAVVTTPIVLCADSVILTGGNYGSSSVYWTGPAFDPLTVPQPSVVVDSSGIYTFVITDGNGCSVTNNVQVTLDHPLQPILPAIICLEDNDDSITVCDNITLTFFPYDSLSNPNANIICIDELTQVLWTISPSSATITSMTTCTNSTAITAVTVSATGWYTITETIIRTSACGNDTTYGQHSFYITVLPSPPPGSLQISLNPNVLMCPGDSAILVASGGSSYIWSNATTNDTLVVYAPGQYSVIGFDTVTNANGCSAISSGSASVTVSVTPQPNVTMLPGNGIICPGDSVEIVSSGTGIFSWQGPNGPIAGTGNTIWSTTPGTYYCILVTPDGCQLLSNSVSLLQYNTPSLQASPAGVLCPGDSVIISLTASSGSSVIWQAPLSGSSLTQTITQPGTYSCTVNACSIATTVSITILMTSVTAVITPLASTTVCEGDSLELGANPGMSTYNWQPGNSNALEIYAHTDGWYYLTTTDSGGCLANDSFQVTFTPNLLTPPSVSPDTTICSGTQATLSASGAPVLTWLTSPTGGPIAATGSPVSVTPIGTTTYYVITDDGVCKSQPQQVTVTTEDCAPSIPNVFTPNGDGVNDFFSVYEPYSKGQHVWIYNRWGELIYEWDGLTGYWDGTYMANGKPCPDGVYYYIANTTDLTNVMKTDSGFIQLIRGGGK